MKNKIFNIKQSQSDIREKCLRLYQIYDDALWDGNFSEIDSLFELFDENDNPDILLSVLVLTHPAEDHLKSRGNFIKKIEYIIKPYVNDEDIWKNIVGISCNED